MTTLDAVPNKKKPDSSAEEVKAKELVRLAREQGMSLTGPDGLLKQSTKSVLEEMTAWVNRPLDGVYAAVFIDAIVVKVRDSELRTGLYAAIGVSLAGLLPTIRCIIAGND